MSFVDNDALGGMSQEQLLEAFCLEQIDAGHQMTIVLEEGVVRPRQIPFQAADARRLDDGGLDAETRAQLLLPLVAQMWGTQHPDALGDAAIQQLSGNHAGLDGLTHAHVIGNQETHRILTQSHDERNVLIGTRRDRQASQGTEWTSSAAQSQADGIVQQNRARQTAGLHWVRSGIGGTLNRVRLQRNKDPRGFLVWIVYGTQPDNLLFFLR